MLIGVLALSLANVATAAKKTEGSRSLQGVLQALPRGRLRQRRVHPHDPDPGPVGTLLRREVRREPTRASWIPNHDNKPVTEVITEEDLELIKKFAIDHAADSEQPMTCG